MARDRSFLSLRQSEVFVTTEPEDLTRTQLVGDPIPAMTDRPHTSGDERLDASGHDDVSYLRQLGYKQELRRALGLLSSFAVSFSCIAVGSGIMITLAVGFEFFGFASFWSWVIGGGLNVLGVGLAISELVSAYPLSGGVYQIINRITRRTYFGWQSGWLIVVAHVAALPAVAIAIAPIIASWFGQHPTGATLIPWVVGLIVLPTIVNLLGVKVTSMVNNLGVLAEIFGIILVLIALLVANNNPQPISIVNENTTDHAWIIGLALAMVFPGFIISAFDAPGNTAEETKRAALTAPKGTTISTISAWLVGTALLILLFLAVPDREAILGSATPVTDILDSAVGHTISNIFFICAVLALEAAVVILQTTAARVLWSQARDGQMPAMNWVRKTSRLGVPANATIITFVIAVIFALWSNLLAVLVAVVSLCWALAYSVAVIVGFWAVVKKRLPEHPWHYGKFSPIIFGVAIVWSVVFVIVLVYTNPQQVGFGILGTVAVGTLLYFAIPKSRRGRIPSLESATSPDDK